MYLTMSFPVDYIYIISDFKELNYTNNTNYVIYSQRKGPVNPRVPKCATIRTVGLNMKNVTCSK